MERRKILEERKVLADRLTRYGVEIESLCYEDFEADRESYMRRLCQKLALNVSAVELHAALDEGPVFEKVHVDDISTFVTNHDQVLQRFGNCYETW